MTFIEPQIGATLVSCSGRDVLKFDQKEQEEYYPCIINPGDVNSLPGNEWAITSVEPSIAQNSSLRFDQVYLVNERLLSPEHHIPVKIDIDNLSMTTIEDPTETAINRAYVTKP